MAGNGSLWTRRQALTAAAGAAAWGGIVGMGAARPAQAAANPVVLVWRPWYNFPNATTPAGQRLLYEGTAPFRAQHPGLDIQMTFLGYQGATVAAILGGDGPDVFEDWVISDYTDQGLLLNLAPYIQQDNLDLSVYPAGMISYLQANGQSAPEGKGFYALPDYLHTLGQAVNLDVVNQLGLSAPQPEWTYQDWANFWLKTTYKSNVPTKARTGGALYWWCGHGNGGAPGDWYWHAWGGGYVDPANNANTIIDSPASLAFAEYFVALMDEGALTPWGNASAFPSGGQVSLPRGSAGGLPWSAANWRGTTWSIFPMPLGSQGRFTAAFESFYAINGATRQPELSWEFLKWLCYETAWPRFMMRLALQGPAHKALWPEWQRIVVDAAPPLRHVGLETLVAQVERDELWTGAPFRYSDTQAGNIIGTYVSQILDHQTSVAAGLRAAAREIRALQVNGGTYARQTVAALQAMERGATLSPPPVDGLGAPPTPPPQGAFTAGTGGSYTLVGDGADVWNPTGNCVFAGSSSTAATADFICRVVALANLDCPHLSQWAKAGLMVCGDLSDVASALTLEVTGHNGVYWQVLATPSAGWQAGGPSSPTAPTGLVGNQVLTLATLPKAAGQNDLIKPLWLRLHRERTAWTPYTSWDGKTWTQAAAPLGMDVGGAWVGLFATAHNSSFQGKGRVRATFDHLNFPVSKVVQIGTP
jgi:hypothetical protein